MEHLDSLPFDHPTRRAEYLGHLYQIRYTDPSGEKSKELAYRLGVEPISKNDDLYYIGPEIDIALDEQDQMFWGDRLAYHEYDLPNTWNPQHALANEDRSFHVPIHHTFPLPANIHYNPDYPWRLRDVVEYNTYENGQLKTKKGVITHTILRYKEGRMPREVNQADFRDFYETPDEVVLGIVNSEYRFREEVPRYPSRQPDFLRRHSTPLGHHYYNAHQNVLRKVGTHFMNY